MKKTLILISIFMIMLVSCSGEKTAVNTTANKTVGLPNPVQEATAEEITERLNVKFAIPDSAKNIRYSIIVGNLAHIPVMSYEWHSWSLINKRHNHCIPDSREVGLGFSM